MSSKVCIECGENKDVSSFSKMNRGVLGVRATCKECRRERENKHRRLKRQEGDPVTKAGDLYHEMVRNSRKRGHEPPEFTRDEITDIITTSTCEVTGLPFDLRQKGTGEKNLYAPSPDRIDCSKGYTKDNVRWVLWFVNSTFMNYDHGDVWNIIEAMYENNVGHRNRWIDTEGDMGSGHKGTGDRNYKQVLWGERVQRLLGERG